MLFFMLQNYPNIKKAVINDINPHLITTYNVIKTNPCALIDALQSLQSEFKVLKSEELRKTFYLSKRTQFNQSGLSEVEEAALMIFLNRTCFNGLYRENSKGEFNVPFGKYVNPTICDSELILADSAILQNVEISQGDFACTGDFVDGYTFVYFDPPYRPLNATSSFNSYVKETFDDAEQIRLKEFYARLSLEGCHAILSNSDCKGRNPDDVFFDELYNGFFIERVYAKRNINANASKRGSLTELLIRNYERCQGVTATLFD